MSFQTSLKFQTRATMNIQPILPRTYAEDCENCTGPTSIDILRFQRTIRAITGRWKIEIVCMLVEGSMRFGALKRGLPGITQHMLTTQLKELAANGIVIRHAFAESPPRVDYALSQAGVDLIPTLRAMLGWSIKYDRFLDSDAASALTTPASAVGMAE